jgi:hypothetical protein
VKGGRFLVSLRWLAEREGEREREREECFSGGFRNKLVSFWVI